MSNEYGSDKILTMTMGEYKDNIREAYSRGGKFVMEEVRELYPDIVNTEMWQDWFWVDDYEEES
jgi:hypothetical protein